MRSLIDSCLDFWLTSGRFNQKFEQLMRPVVGRKTVLTCNSGSSANFIGHDVANKPNFRGPRLGTR